MNMILNRQDAKNAKRFSCQIAFPGDPGALAVEVICFARGSYGNQ
jgi:hypothetical protein